MTVMILMQRTSRSWGGLGRQVALDLMRESCGLFSEEVGGRQLLWDPILKGKGAQKY